MMQEDKPTGSKMGRGSGAVSRRSAIKMAGAAVLGGGALTGSASAIDGRVTELTEMNKSTVREFYEQMYPRHEAEIVARGWDHLRDRVVNGDLTRDEAHDKMTNYLVAETVEISQDLSEHHALQAENRKKERQFVESPTEDIVTVSSEEEIPITQTEEGESGVGVTETRFLDDSYMEARAYSGGYGDATVWTECYGFFYSPESGQYEITCDYYRRGTVTDADAEIELFVEEIGGNRRSETLDTGSNRGETSETVAFYLAGEANYRVGVRFEGSLLSFSGTMYSDYYTSARCIDVKSIVADIIG